MVARRLEAWEVERRLLHGLYFCLEGDEGALFDKESERGSR